MTSTPSDTHTPAPTETLAATETPTPQPVAAARGRLAYTINKGPYAYDIYLINLDGTGRQMLVPDASEPSFTRDGQRVMFYNWKGGAVEIMRLDGSERLVQGRIEDRVLPGTQVACRVDLPGDAVVRAQVQFHPRVGPSQVFQGACQLVRGVVGGALGGAQAFLDRRQVRLDLA